MSPVAQKRPLGVLCFFCLTWALLCAPLIEGRHILAVDLGADWAKAATLGSGSGASLRPSVVLNDQTNRKSPQCVAFSFLPYEGSDVLQGVERSFAEMAWALEPRYPEQVVCGSSLLAGHVASRGAGGSNTTATLTGRGDENLLSADDIAMLPFTMLPQSSRDTVSVRIVGGKDKKKVLEFAPEELVGMIFAYLKRIAERGLDGEPVRHLVVTVPTTASLAHRQAIVDAAAIAGLRAVRLVHTTTAAAVQLAYINTEQLFTSSRERGAKYIMVYDMGSRRTEAAVYKFMPSKRQSGKITLLATRVNNRLGGLAFDRCIARYVERELFPKAKPTPIKPVLGISTTAARKASVSLLRAANSARERLSVNQEAPLVVQGVRENSNSDFTATISRATFERECVHLFDEAVRVRDEVMAQAIDTVPNLQNLTRFEVIGGATRMPRLLERLSDGYGRVVDRTLNSDEASVVGATYMGAVRAGIPLRGFDVVEPLTHDVYFSVTPQLNAAGAQSKNTRHLLFAEGRTLVPAVHSLRFQNRTAEFTLTLEDKSGHFARAVTVHGVDKGIAAAQELTQRWTADGGVKGAKERLLLEGTEVVVEVTMTESGIPSVSNAYLRARYMRETVAEQQGAENEEEKSSANGTHEEFSSSAGSADGENVTVAKTLRGDENGTLLNQTKEQPDEGEREGEGERDNENNQEKEKENIVDGDLPGAEKLLNDMGEMERVVRNFPLHLTSSPMSVGVNLNKTETVIMRDRLRAFQRVDDEQLLRSALRNDLESLILHYKSLDAWNNNDANNEEERGKGGDATNWRGVVADVSRWLEDANDFVEISALQEQHRRLKELQIGVTATN